jgi:hypothetical protein
MKVAFTSDTYWPRVNGVSVSTEIFMKELTKLGHTIRLWAPEYPGSEDRHDGQDITRLASFALPFSPEDRQPAPFQEGTFFRELDEFGPELIHIQTEFTLSLMARKYARRRSLPVVMTCHTYFEQYINFYLPMLPKEFAKRLARQMTYRLFRRADAIITPTEPMKAVLESYGLTCPITVVPTGIPEEDFAGISKEEEHQASVWVDRHPEFRDRRLMLYAGRVGQEKNMDFLLDVVERVRQTEPRALLAVAGAGPYLDAFRGQIASRGLGGHVVCLGYVDRQELKHLYALADVFTFASVTETQGLVTIEAMLCGTPAVAVGKMGTKIVMGGDHGGFMVDEDVGAFADAVLRLLGDPVLYAAKSAEARAHALNWTAGRMVGRIEAVYRKVIAEFQPGKPARRRRRPS